MKIIINNKTFNLEIANTFFKKFLGLMGKKNIKTGYFFPKTKSIHTFFMKEHIDVLLCDNDNTILYYYSNLSPNKIILPKKGVSKVYEIPVGYFDIKINEKVVLK